MSAMPTESEFADLRSRVEAAEIKIAQLQGSFGFITTQLRDIQLYMHAKFEQIDRRLDGVDAKFVTMDAKFVKMDQKLDALPAVIARTMTELLDARLPPRPS